MPGFGYTAKAVAGFVKYPVTEVAGEAGEVWDQWVPVVVYQPLYVALVAMLVSVAVVFVSVPELVPGLVPVVYPLTHFGSWRTPEQKIESAALDLVRLQLPGGQTSWN